MGTEQPAHGERPFNLKNAQVDEKKPKGQSYLNEQRLKEHVSFSLQLYLTFLAL